MDPQFQSERIIALIDMDCFYCQVEQREKPELWNKPVAVVQYNQYQGGGLVLIILDFCNTFIFKMAILIETFLQLNN